MKICIVKLSAIGDIIHAMVTLQFIKKVLPHSRIDWIVEGAFVDVLKNNPHIDNILPINLKSLKKRKSEIFTQYKILKTYSKNNYDIVIDAQGLLKSAIVAKIIGAKTVAGFDKKSIREGIASLFYDKKVSIAYDANTIDRNVAVLCEPLGI
ncbi:MAG: glycosyltransferase family 9 protein, partial [Sulfurimonadaceae bacterium]